MRAALRNVVVLAGFAAAAGGALAWFATITADDAARNRAAAEARILRELAGVDLAAVADIVLCERNLAVLIGGGSGYGGAFRLAVALDLDGAVRGVRVLENRETPGFADIIEAGSEWLESFRAGDRPHAVTGATVTSRAVLDAVQRAVDRLRRDAPGRCP